MKKVQLEIVLGTVFVFLSAAILIIMGAEENDRLAEFKETQRAEQIEFGASVFEINCTGCHGSRAQGIVGVAPCLRCRQLFAATSITVDGENYLIDGDTQISAGIAPGRIVRVEYTEENNVLTAALIEVIESEDAPGNSAGQAVGRVDVFSDRIGQVGWEGGLENYIVSVVSKGVQISTRPQYLGGGSPAMPTWSDQFGGPLRKDQIAAVAAFITNFESWALDPDLIPVPLIAEVDQSDPVSRGRAVFLSLETGCATCHAITNVSVGTLGPPLDGLASRAGSREPGLAAEEYIRKSVLDPVSFVVEGFDPIMPSTFGDILTTEQLDDLVAFLLTLEE